MKIGYCKNCAMDKNSAGDRFSRRRIAIQITVDVIIWLAAGCMDVINLLSIFKYHNESSSGNAICADDDGIHPHMANKTLGLSVLVLYLFLYGKPHETGFFCDDRSLSYPSLPETISTSVLVTAGIAVSVLLVISVEVLNCLDNKCLQPCQRARDILFCVKSYVVFMIGFLIQELVVDVVKNKMGVLRPNFFDICRQQFNRTLCPGYISEYTCNGTEHDKELRSSRQSFPSGHSAFSMYIAVYFCIYIENHLQISFSRLFKLFLQTGLILIAILCGIGRINDNKHHTSDVIAGYILGIIVAVFVHLMLGMKFVKAASGGEKTTLQTRNKSCECCCTCEQFEQSSDVDPQTPAHLLQTECFQNIENVRNSSSTKLIALQNNNHRTMSETSEIV